MKLILLMMCFFLAALVTASQAQFNGCPSGFCAPKAATAATNFLLSNGGSNLLVNTGVKFKVQ